MLRIVYEGLSCTDPDWGGTNTELTRIYLVATLGVNICSVCVPSLLVWWSHTKNIPSWSAIMLCYDGQLRNSSVASHIISFNSTATSSATSEYVTVLEQLSRNDETTSRNIEQTRNASSSYLVLHQNLFSELICILFILEQEMLSYLAHFFSP